MGHQVLFFDTYVLIKASGFGERIIRESIGIDGNFKCGYWVTGFQLKTCIKSNRFLIVANEIDLCVGMYPWILGI